MKLSLSNIPHYICKIVIFFFISYAYSSINIDSYSIAGYTDEQLRVDETIELVIDCRAVSTGETNLIPHLNLPASCSGFENRVNITLKDAQNYPVSVSSGQSFSVSFYVHMMNDTTEDGDGSLCTSTCLEGSGFELSFTRGLDGTSPAVTGEELILLAPGNNVGYLKNVLVGRINQPVDLHSANWDLIYNDVNDTSIFMSDFNPEVDRLMLYLDWDSESGTIPWNGFDGFTIPIAGNGASSPPNCNYQFLNDLSNGTLELYTGTAIHDMGNSIDTGSMEPGDLIVQAPLGGGGGPVHTYGTGVNLFDITEMVTGCGVAYQNLDFNQNATVFSFIDCRASWAVIRQVAIVHMEQQGCSSVNPSFLVENDDEFILNNTEVTRYINESNGNEMLEVETSISIPSEWENNGQLASDFQVEWYILSDSEIERVFVSDNRALTFDEQIDGGLESFKIMAVVSYNSGQAYVSKTSELFNIPIESQFTFDFDQAELTPDSYQDPGEDMQVVFNYTSGISVTGLTYGYIDLNDTKVYYKPFSGSYDGILSNASYVTVGGGAGDYWPNPAFRLLDSGQSLQTTGSVTLPYRLLEANQKSSCTFFVEIKQNFSNSEFTYTHKYNLYELDAQQTFDLNAELETIDRFNGVDQSSEFSHEAREDNLLSQPVPSNQDLWQYQEINGEMQWVCEAPSNNQENELHTLTTSTASLTDEMTLEFWHKRDFSTWTEGGFIEYQTYNLLGAIVQPWQNIEQIAILPTNLYDTDALGGGNSKLAAEGDSTWVTADGTWTKVSVPFVRQSNWSSIAFRFVFQSPTSNNTTGSYKWQIRDIELDYQDLLRDNVFHINLDAMLNLCFTGETVEFLDPEVDPEDYNYVWYESKEELYDGIGTPGSNKLPFASRSVREGSIYYVKIKHGSNTGPSRIYPFLIDDTGTNGSFCDLINIFNEPGQYRIEGWPETYDVRDLLFCDGESDKDCQAAYLVKHLNKVYYREANNPTQLILAEVTYDAVLNQYVYDRTGSTQSRDNQNGMKVFDEIQAWVHVNNGLTIAQAPRMDDVSFNTVSLNFIFNPESVSSPSVVPPGYYQKSILDLSPVGSQVDIEAWLELKKQEHAAWIVDQVNSNTSSYEIEYVNQPSPQYQFVTPSMPGEVLQRDIGWQMQSYDTVKDWADNTYANSLADNVKAKYGSAGSTPSSHFVDLIVIPAPSGTSSPSFQYENTNGNFISMTLSASTALVDVIDFWMDSEAAIISQNLDLISFNAGTNKYHYVSSDNSYTVEISRSTGTGENQVFREFSELEEWRSDQLAENVIALLQNEYPAETMGGATRQLDYDASDFVRLQTNSVSYIDSKGDSGHYLSRTDFLGSLPGTPLSWDDDWKDKVKDWVRDIEAGIVVNAINNDNVTSPWPHGSVSEGDIDYISESDFYWYYGTSYSRDVITPGSDAARTEADIRTWIGSFSDSSIDMTLSAWKDRILTQLVNNPPFNTLDYSAVDDHFIFTDDGYTINRTSLNTQDTTENLQDHLYQKAVLYAKTEYPTSDADLDGVINQSDTDPFDGSVN
ncbi:MAG: hypothetical protein CSA81_07660 [Acidobacteria bacterium]|nr:MAG: hypothetical protein CSA81_07660 [Acidobacteriota bacterium]